MNMQKKVAPALADEPTPSLVQQIANLTVGKCISVAERFDGNAATKETIKSSRLRQRNTVAAAVRRAENRTGNSYITEGGEINTRSLDTLVIVAITRTASSRTTMDHIKLHNRRPITTIAKAVAPQSDHHLQSSIEQAVAAVLIKLGEHSITITPEDLLRLEGKLITVTPVNHDGLLFEISSTV